MKYDFTKGEGSPNQRSGNDEQWIAGLMQTYYSDMFNYGKKLTADDGCIKDSIQEVFISLWQRRHTAAEILSPKFYFLRAVKNKILKSLDSAARRKKINLSLDEYDFTHEFSIEKIIVLKEISAENSTRLQLVLAGLSRREKEIIYLKYYQLLDNAQIAELMNISRQSVYNLLYGTILKLRACWKSEFIER